MKVLQFAINTIHHMDSTPKVPVLKIQKPHAVFEIDDEHVAGLQAIGATRDPTDDEKALWAMANRPEPAAAPKAPDAPKAPAPIPAAPAGGGGKPDGDGVG